MAAVALHRRPLRGAQMAAALIVGVGRVIGYARPRLNVLPGLGGAAAVSAGLGAIAGHVFGHGLTPWVAAVVAGLFLLQIDRHRGPRQPGA